jgi:pilus assembly protein Flp/PilA
MGEAQQALGLLDAAGRRAAHRLVARFSLTFGRLCSDEGGATAVEYGLIVACITLAILGGMQFFAGNETAMYNHISTTIVTATTH